MRRIPLRYLANLNTAVLPEDTDSNFRFRYVDISQVSSAGAVAIPEEYVAFGEAPSRARRLAASGDTLVSTVRTYLRAIAPVPPSADPLVFSTGFAVLAPREDPRFLSYACRSDVFVEEVVSRSVGVSYPAIAPDDLMDIVLPAPEESEQRRIADFLDDRVARIDQIIAARRNQIELVNESSRSRLQDLQDEWSGEHGWTRLGRALRGLEQGWSPQAEAIPASFEVGRDAGWVREWGDLPRGRQQATARRPCIGDKVRDTPGRPSDVASEWFP